MATKAMPLSSIYQCRKSKIFNFPLDFFLNFFQYFRTPFNSKTPFGYLVEISIQFISLFFLLMNCACVLIFLSGACLILISFIGDIKKDLRNLKVIEKKQLTMKFYEIIEFHYSVKQLSKGDYVINKYIMNI